MKNLMYWADLRICSLFFITGLAIMGCTKGDDAKLDLKKSDEP